MASPVSTERHPATVDLIGSIDSIVIEHEPGLVAFARSRGADDPEGLVNEVFLRFFRRRAGLTFDHDAEIGGYLYRSATNLMTDEYRRRRSRPEEVGPPPADLVATGSSFEDRVDDSLHLEQLLNQLSVDQRTVVELRFLEDLTVEETAARLEKPVGTVKSLQHHGVKRLRALALVALAALALVAGIFAVRSDRSAQSVQPIDSIDGHQSEQPIPPAIPEPRSEDDGLSAVARLDGVDVASTVTAQQREPVDRTSTSLPSSSTSVAAGSPPVAVGVSAGPTAESQPSPGPSPVQPTTTSLLPEPVAPSVSAVSVADPPAPEPPTPEAAGSLVGPVQIEAASSGKLLWIRESDHSLRANGTPDSPASCFTIVRIDASTIAIEATIGARQDLLGVQNDADNALRARGGDGKRPWLIAYRNDDGTYRFASATFPGRLLRVDGASVDSGGIDASDPQTRFRLSPIDGCS